MTFPPLCMWQFVCLQIRMYEVMHVHTHTPAHRVQETTSGVILSQGSSSGTLSSLFDKGSLISLVWGFTHYVRLSGQSVRYPPVSASLVLGLQAYYYVWHFYMESGDQSQVPKLVRQVLSQLNHPSSLKTFIYK